MGTFWGPKSWKRSPWGPGSPNGDPLGSSANSSGGVPPPPSPQLFYFLDAVSEWVRHSVGNGFRFWIELSHLSSIKQWGGAPFGSFIWSQNEHGIAKQSTFRVQFSCDLANCAHFWTSFHRWGILLDQVQSQPQSSAIYSPVVLAGWDLYYYVFHACALPCFCSEWFGRKIDIWTFLTE